MNRLRPLDRGFESHSRHGCLCAFILCLCCSVYSRGLATSWSPVQGVLPTVYMIKKLQSGQSLTKGSRAIQRERIIHTIALWTVAMYSISFFFLIQKVSGLNLDEEMTALNRQISTQPSHYVHSFPMSLLTLRVSLPLFNLCSWLTVIKYIMKRKET
jgi:hypothetical protein